MSAILALTNSKSKRPTTSAAPHGKEGWDEVQKEVLVGPSPAYVQRVRGRWRWQIILRGRDPAALVRDFVLAPHWAVDVDPASLL